MARLNDAEKARLRAAIRAAEARTDGEIVTVIAATSMRDTFYPMLWAGVLAICSTALLKLLWFEPAYGVSLTVELLLFSLLAWGLQQPACTRWLVPRAVRRAACAQAARAQFCAQGLYRTRGATGVLLYVSLAERQVELLADEGIHRLVPAGAWDGIVQQLIVRVRAGEAGDGFVVAVEAVGALLAHYAPATGDNPNELPDHLVEL